MPDVKRELTERLFDLMILKQANKDLDIAGLDALINRVSVSLSPEDVERIERMADARRPVGAAHDPEEGLARLRRLMLYSVKSAKSLESALRAVEVLCTEEDVAAVEEMMRQKL